MSSRKTYKNLCSERESILDEMTRWKISSFTGNRMGLWSSSTYLDELLYIKQTIEKEMMPHQIVQRMKFYKNFESKTGLPYDLVLYIASFGDIIDQTVMKFLGDGVKPDIDEIGNY